ncbi:tyrosine--tRNA ligase [bacterium]|nr:tyrosine--tRNA ligase [bacterium]
MDAHFPKGLLRGVEGVVTEEELAALLASGKSVSIKVGVDPTSPELHLGHLVFLRIMRRFQDLYEQVRVVFVEGTFTALIGDPSGRNATRPVLTPEEIATNSRSYQRQVERFLVRGRTHFHPNAGWLETMNARKILQLCQNRSLNRLLEREDFRSRLEAGLPIRLHELLYPVFQAQDSVHLAGEGQVGCDIEIGGRDQLPNFMTTRDAMRDAGLTPEVVLTVPLLVGTDGKRKMSKSYGNQIGVEERAEDIYGKLMSLPDSATADYLNLLTDLEEERMDVLLAGHPMEAKLVLAYEVTKGVAGKEEAGRAADHFRATVREGGEPERVASLALAGPLTLRDAVLGTLACKSGGEAKRLIVGGGVTLDGVKATDPSLVLEPGYTGRLRAGKRHWVDLEVT